jgi:hypothetical protein
LLHLEYDSIAMRMSGHTGTGGGSKLKARESVCCSLAESEAGFCRNWDASLRNSSKGGFVAILRCDTNCNFVNSLVRVHQNQFCVVLHNLYF